MDPSSIPIALLQTFVAVADYGTLAAAAQHLGITQPTVSRQMQQFARYFPVALFKTLGRRKLLTPFGLELLGPVQSNLSRMQAEMRRIQLSYQGEAAHLPIRIGGRLEILTTLFQNLNPKPAVELIPTTSDEALEKLLSGQLEMAVSRKIEVSSDLIKRPFFKNEFQLCVPRSWVKGVPIDNWIRKRGAHFPLILHPGVQTIFQELLEILKSASDEKVNRLKPSILIQDWSFIEQKIAKGMGWGIVPSIFIPSYSLSYEVMPLPKSIKNNLVEYFVYYHWVDRNQKWLKLLLSDLIHS